MYCSYSYFFLSKTFSSENISL